MMFCWFFISVLRWKDRDRYGWKCWMFFIFFLVGKKCFWLWKIWVNSWILKFGLIVIGRGIMVVWVLCLLLKVVVVMSGLVVLNCVLVFGWIWVVILFFVGLIILRFLNWVMVIFIKLLLWKWVCISWFIFFLGMSWVWILIILIWLGFNYWVYWVGNCFIILKFWE